MTRSWLVAICFVGLFGGFPGVLYGQPGEIINQESLAAKKTYLKELKPRIEGWTKSLHDLEEREKSANKTVKRTIRATARYLRIKLRDVEADFAKLHEAGDDTWRGLKRKIESQLSVMKDRYEGLAA